MRDIKVLSEQLANKIAAGEVVERPVSIIKELIENAIDAESSKIDIELIDSGIRQISITDNGTGVLKNNLKLMTKRHATSKIYTEEELLEVNSLGFRGEALASISAVSQLEIISSIDGINVFKYNNQDEIIKETKGNKGTKIIVKNLFYNTPARYKHLSHPNYELTLISSFIKKISLIYPNIKFSLKNNNKEIFKTLGNNNVFDILKRIYTTNSNYFEKLTYQQEDYNINMYIGLPELNRAKKEITISINQRLIKNYEIENAIIKGYQGFLHTNEYPIVFLEIEIDPSLIDVNIHPTKQQIKLSFLKEICNDLTKIINNRLQKYEYIPNFGIDEEKIVLKENNNEGYESSMEIEELSFDFNKTKKTIWKLPNFDYIGSLYQTYLLFQNEEGLYLVDQHAAQERINYEIIMNKFANREFNYQNLMIPIIISLNYEQNIIFKKIYQDLNQIGIICEEFGENSYKISEIDNFYLKCKNLENDLYRIINLFIEEKNLLFNQLFEDVCIMMACKSSIKAHQYLNSNDVLTLINDLNDCDNPFTCPHGRPIINKITKYEIEKLFKRT